MAEIIIQALRQIDDIMSRASRNVQRLLSSTFLVGSTVLKDNVNWNVTPWKEDNDVDLLYYNPVDKERKKGINKLSNYFALNKFSELNIDLIQFIDTDEFMNDANETLTNYIFNTKKEKFTQKGYIRVLNLQGLFLTKLAMIHSNKNLHSINEKEMKNACVEYKNNKNYMALKIIYEKEFNKNLPYEVKEAINAFNKFKEKSRISSEFENAINKFSESCKKELKQSLLTEIKNKIITLTKKGAIPELKNEIETFKSNLNPNVKKKIENQINTFNESGMDFKYKEFQKIYDTIK
jgi:hypothetical protein